MYKSLLTLLLSFPLLIYSTTVEEQAVARAIRPLPAGLPRFKQRNVKIMLRQLIASQNANDANLLAEIYNKSQDAIEPAGFTINNGSHTVSAAQGYYIQTILKRNYNDFYIEEQI
jgi:hypothetical protein